MFKYLVLLIFIISLVFAQPPPKIPENFSAIIQVINYYSGTPPITYEEYYFRDQVGRRLRHDIKSYWSDTSEFLFFGKDRDVTLYIADHRNKSCIKQPMQMDFPEMQVPPGAYYNGTWTIQGIETDNWRYDTDKGEYYVFSFAKTDRRIVNVFISTTGNKLQSFFGRTSRQGTGNHAFQNNFVQSIIPRRPDDKDFILPQYCRQ